MKMDIVNEYIREKQKKEEIVVKRIKCRDGFEFSVQASHYHHCLPREDNAFPYSEFEVGYPSEKEPLLFEYVEDTTQPEQTVYGWVPLNIILEIINKHQGMMK